MAKKLTQADLPGMEDRELADLEICVREYVELRDQRVALTPLEIAKKDELHGLMRKHKKTEYNRDGIKIWIVSEAETVKVKVTAADDPESGDTTADAVADRVGASVDEATASKSVKKRKAALKKAGK